MKETFLMEDTVVIMHTYSTFEAAVAGKVNFPTKIVIITFALAMLVQNKHIENMLNQVFNQFGNASWH